ncbi:MAG: CotH kinase family protein [Bacteroidetes bacterium]|nr:CotH kinase family protein [Bacteroidota bacterium]
MKTKYAFFSWIAIMTFYTLPLISTSQPAFPEPGMVYSDVNIPRIDILIHPDSLLLIYEYPESDHEYPATFVFDNGTIRDTADNVGFRLRGNTSRWAAKKSFKVSFNTFIPGRKYYGIEKMNLNGEHNDPSVIRSKLCWDLLRELGVPAPRSNHVEVYINDSFYGLYINVEHIDEEFVLSRFGNNDGNLYKCLWPADLNYLGTNPNLYKFEENGRRAYELKTNESLDDYSDLTHFIDVLNNTPINEFPCEIEKVFNVFDYLKIMASDVSTANWDGYIFNKNNFYLYHNTASGQFEYIPYDLDNTFGIDWFGIDWSTRDVYSWEQSQENRPLFERILQVQRYRDIYSYYLNIFSDSLANPASFFPQIEDIRDKIYPSVANDPYYPQDYGYSTTDFLNSYTQSLGAHVPVGLEPYISQRRQATLNQIVINDISPVINYFNHTPAITNQEIWMRAYAMDDRSLAEVILELSGDVNPIQEVPMLDDGLHHDFEAGDGIFGASAGVFTSEAQIGVNIRCTDDMGNISYLYCEPRNILVGSPVIPELFINEFMASNATTIADEYGEFDDWVEIYNAGTEPVWLGNLFLTDNLENPDKWQFPDYTLAPDSYLLIWADDQPEQGPFHATYKLDKDGEQIGIFGPEEMGYPVIDSLSYGIQETDISYGRYPNAAMNWQTFNYPTPGYSNTSGLGLFEYPKDQQLMFYPNPASGDNIRLFQNSDIRIYDYSGRLVSWRNKTDKVEIGNLTPGMYIIIDEYGRNGKLIVY